MPSCSSVHHCTCSADICPLSRPSLPDIMIIQHMASLNGKRIVLASGSPRRREILTVLGTLRHQLPVVVSLQCVIPRVLVVLTSAPNRCSNT